MPSIYFSYERSAKKQAIKTLVVAIGFPISMWFMLDTFAQGEVTSKEEIIIYGVSFLVSIFLLLVFVIPDFKRKGSFSFEVTDSMVRCYSPDGENYEVNLVDIKRVLQIKKASGNWFDEIIEMKDGRKYSIPKKYDLNIHNAVKAIKKANPEIIRENTVRY